MGTEWTWQHVLRSDPAGATQAEAGFAAVARAAARLSAVVDRIGQAPWSGDAAEQFRDYAAVLGRSIRDVEEAADAGRSAAAAAGADLEALRGPAGDAATLLNQLSAADAQVRAGQPVDRLPELEAEAIGALKRVRAERGDTLDTLASKVGGGIERLLDRPLPPECDSDELTVMTLNVGGGAGNSGLSSDGMDEGDVDELARRIVAQDVDVAALQEVWQMDVARLERELEERTGEDWDLHFVQASSKFRTDDGLFEPGYPDQPFGQVIAVRRGDGVAYSELVGTEKLDEPGDDGSDGRAAISVRVHTDNGGVVDVATAHTDYDGVSEADRAGQIDQLREFAEAGADGNPVIITGDLNHAMTGDGRPSRALQDYVDAGYTDASDIGPTEQYGDGPRRLDYIFTGPDLTAGDPERVQGDSPDHEGQDHDLSDHDGIVVDVEVPVSGRSPTDPPPNRDFDDDADHRPDNDY
ncbi:MAG TPA: endonuclease/exonuclease/phosphatase family protein [Actinophytocola sp.]|uniref:endonuclease/exonuclease/phosphatase family protein n=1 Tax=Actinophytocola sp. TaxID=1872138 RepID=UPI002DBD0422|nr:endonuclease/exonuclease/phosphatase family protein [Actinophytocola sp.]HEU5471269.1 endonuclease/exonuclease/phosphatase family protein [Actinophytocola sp.]